MQNEAEYRCPVCNAVIGLEDVNVAADLALCRSCGNTSPFSIVVNSSEILLHSSEIPPRWIRLEKDFSGATLITYHRISPVLLFLIPFTALWSGLSMWGIYGTQIQKGQFDPEQSLFGLPFLIGTVILLSIIVYLLFGKWKITLRKGTGTVFVGMGPVGWNRHFVYNQNSLVSMQTTNVKVNDVSQKGILIRTDENDFVFGALIKDEAKQFIAAAILKEIKRMKTV